MIVTLQNLAELTRWAARQDKVVDDALASVKAAHPKAPWHIKNPTWTSVAPELCADGEPQVLIQDPRTMQPTPVCRSVIKALRQASLQRAVQSGELRIESQMQTDAQDFVVGGVQVFKSLSELGALIAAGKVLLDDVTQEVSVVP